MSKVISGEIDLLESTVGPWGAIDWYVGEKRQGWTGFASFNPGPGEDLTPDATFDRTAKAGLVPGTPIRFGVWLRPKSSYSFLPVQRDAEVEHVRSWPSVISAVYAPVYLEEGFDDWGSLILFSDPVTFLLGVPIWGVFRDRSPGELLAGGMLLAAGINAEPSLQPAIPGLPDIEITEFLREGVEQIPYAVAAGETLGAWLGAIFGRLGVRMELLGDPSEARLHVSLRVAEPVGDPVGMTLRTAYPTTTGAVISSMEAGPAGNERSTVVDNPSIGQPRRIGSSPSVDRLYTSAELTLDEASERVSRVGGHAALHRNRIRVVTRQPGLHPGRIVQFDQTITGAQRWQVNGVAHGAGDGRYRNEAELMKLGIWTPSTLPDRGVVTVSGVVHEPSVEPGETVERDALSRVPVRLCFGQDAPVPGADDEQEGQESVGAFAAPPPPELRLPVATLMAGGEHGFVPGHRHGDVCRVAIHHPMAAEIVGFAYADHRRVGEELVDVSMGVVVSLHDEEWSGLVFQPGEIAEEEEEELERLWRQGRS